LLGYCRKNKRPRRKESGKEGLGWNFKNRFPEVCNYREGVVLFTLLGKKKILMTMGTNLSREKTSQKLSD